MNDTPFFDDFASSSIMVDPPNVVEIDFDTFNMNYGENMTSLDDFDWYKAADFDQIIEVKNAKQETLLKITKKNGVETANWNEIARIKEEYLAQEKPFNMLGAICTALWYARNS